MPRPAPKPLMAPVPQSRFDAFMERNVVVIAIVGALAFAAVVTGIASLFH
jgi:hypothetical protein